MASPRNSSSRAEIDHSKPDGNSCFNNRNTESMLYNASTTSHQDMANGGRIKVNFSEFVDKCEMEEDRRETDLTHQNKYRRTVDFDFEESESQSEYESDAEPSPTPVISDLEDDVMCDTPNIQRVMNANEIQAAAFPLHGISIPYLFEDEDSDTPEPLDTPQTPGYECTYNAMGLEELKLSSDEDDSDLDYAFIVDDEAEFPALSPKSRSWQRITMTKMNYKRCKRIKSITPITTEMAEWKINNIYTRRRSVAMITPTAHRLFQLDPDLLEIRQQYLARSRANDTCEPMEMHPFTTIVDEPMETDEEEEVAGHDSLVYIDFLLHLFGANEYQLHNT
eukprot:231833_1